MKMEGFPSAWCSPRLVIPAHAGIQVRCAELAWIPAFAGMTERRRASWFPSPNGYFQRSARRSRSVKTAAPQLGDFGEVFGRESHIAGRGVFTHLLCVARSRNRHGYGRMGHAKG